MQITLNSNDLINLLDKKILTKDEVRSFFGFTSKNCESHQLEKKLDPVEQE